MNKYSKDTFYVSNLSNDTIVGFTHINKNTTIQYIYLKISDNIWVMFSNDKTKILEIGSFRKFTKRLRYHTKKNKNRVKIGNWLIYDESKKEYKIIKYLKDYSMKRYW